MELRRADEDVLRFAVGEPDGARSNRFRAWLGGDGSIYIGSRLVAGDYKASLHPAGQPWTFPPGGDFRFAFRHEFVKARPDMFPPEPERRKRRVIPFAPVEESAGVWRAFTIFIPASSVAVPAYGGVEEERHIWIPAPPPRHVVIVSVLVTDAALDWKASIPAAGKPLGFFETGGVARIWFSAFEREQLPREAESWYFDEERTRRNAAEHLRGDEPADYRALGVVGLADGTKGWVDLLVAQKSAQA